MRCSVGRRPQPLHAQQAHTAQRGPTFGTAWRQRSTAGSLRPLESAYLQPERERRSMIALSESRREGGGFWTGFALGGALFGAAGFFFAPQISRAILNEQQKFKVPKWFNEDKPPVTKAELEEKIDQLHAAINEVASSVGPERTSASSLGQINNEVLEKAGHS